MARVRCFAAALVALSLFAFEVGCNTSGDVGATTDEAGSDGGVPSEDSIASGDSRSNGDSKAGPDTKSGVDAKADGGPGVDGGTAGDTKGGGPDSTPPPTDSGPPPTGGYLVGYWADWTRSTMPPATIPWSKLTHVAHAFVLPAAGGGLQSVSSYVDAELVTQAHLHGVKVVASVGGAGANFDGNVDPTARAATVSALADLCKTHHYDGIDIDWEFPSTSTAPAWKSLVSELRTALDAIDPSLSISAAVASGPWNGDALPSDGLKMLTWIGVMTYDYAGSWSSTSGHLAPLYPSAGGDGGSVSQSVDYYVTKRGMPADHVLLGLPFYGAEFGASAIASTPVAPASSPDYRDVVPMMGAGGWISAWDDGAKVPYLHRASSPGFLSYDDAKSIDAKCAYRKSRALKGAIVWHLAGDRMSDGSNPLLEAAQPCR